MKQPIHIGIPNASENQKTIIESAISLVEIYKHMINIKKIRREKLKQKRALNSAFKEMKTLVNQLAFPKMEEHEEHKKIIKSEKPERPKEKSKKQSRLDRELQELKRKLKKIQ